MQHTTTSVNGCGAGGAGGVGVVHYVRSIRVPRSKGRGRRMRTKVIYKSIPRR